AVDVRLRAVQHAVAARGAHAVHAAGARAVGGDDARLTLRAARAGGVGAAAIDVRLRAVQHAVAARAATDTVHAAPARALCVGAASVIDGAETAQDVAAIDHGLVPVGDAVGARRRLTAEAHARGAAGRFAHAALAVGSGRAG